MRSFLLSAVLLALLAITAGAYHAPQQRYAASHRAAAGAQPQYKARPSASRGLGPAERGSSLTDFLLKLKLAVESGVNDVGQRLSKGKKAVTGDINHVRSAMRELNSLNVLNYI